MDCLFQIQLGAYNTNVKIRVMHHITDSVAAVENFTYCLSIRIKRGKKQT